MRGMNREYESTIHIPLVSLFFPWGHMKTAAVLDQYTYVYLKLNKLNIIYSECLSDAKFRGY